jgi:TolB protein
MRTIAATLAAGALLRLMGPPAPPILTVPQQDRFRSNLDAASAAVSADGRYVAFTSYARLAPADTNDRRDIYVLDRADGRVTLESVTSAGVVSSADSDHPRLSGNGRMLVYETIVAPPGSVLVRSDVVLRDRREGTSRVISGAPSGEPANGWAYAPEINRDGTSVVFASTATNLDGADANGSGDDVFVFDVHRGSIRRISLDSSGGQSSSGISTAPAVSADGRYIAFTSTAGLTPSTREEANAGRRRRVMSYVYIRDTRDNTTRLVSVASGPRLPDGPSWAPAISASGAAVAFVSDATNLAAADGNRSADVFVSNLQTGAIELVSRSLKGDAANGPSGSPALSADGRLVVFQSEASDLVCAQRCTAATEDINLLADVFLLDRDAGAMTRVSGDGSGGWMEPSGGPAFDAAGEVFAYSSRHPMNADDTQNDFDLFVCVAPARHGRNPP